MNNYIFALNLKVFDNTEGLIYYLNAIDIKHQFLSAKFKILNNPSKTVESRSLIKITKICWWSFVQEIMQHIIV